MILANVAAAEMLEKKALPLIYRVHDEPTAGESPQPSGIPQDARLSFAKSGALRPELFNRVLDQVKGHDFELLVNEVVLRSQAQAEYSAENYGHFGLNLRRYADFTSPIRRYADLIVHRALIRASASATARCRIPRRGNAEPRSLRRFPSPSAAP